MKEVRRGQDRGHLNHGWLDTYHSFSFGDYYDPARMGFRALRVINEDRVDPGQGFGMHGHRDMEIVTLVLEGALEHRDSLGNGEILKPGELQRMTAGTGIRHSEFNPSASEAVHLYQIWLQPERPGLPPSYEQKQFDATEQDGRWRVVASRDGREGSLVIHQDAALFLAGLKAGETLTRPFASGRHGWLQVLRGRVTAEGLELVAGDALALSNEEQLTVTANAGAELLLFDLA
ncbi:MAG: Pirin-related protein [Planctomycetaceae bacterium]|nr:Pirin-related protein [Planctomycetaceae bacterium]